MSNNNSNRLPFPELSGQHTNQSPLILNNPIRPEALLDVKRSQDLPTLPSLNEVMKPIFDNQMYNLQNPNNPKAPLSPGTGPRPQLPQNVPPKNMLPLPSLLNPLQQPIPTTANKQNLYLVNERNQIEFDPSRQTNIMHANMMMPPMSNMNLPMMSGPMVPMNMPPNIISQGYGSPSMSPKQQHHMNPNYQEQIQQAKRIGESMQSNVRNYIDQSNKKRKPNESPTTNNNTVMSPTPMMPQFPPESSHLSGENRSAFSPMKKRDTPPPQQMSPQSSQDDSDSESKLKIGDDQNNFAHLLQHNFNGVNLSNDNAAELLSIYRNFHKNDSARLTPMEGKNPVDDGKKEIKS